jgi:hypothetical protein
MVAHGLNGHDGIVALRGGGLSGFGGWLTGAGGYSVAGGHEEDTWFGHRLWSLTVVETAGLARWNGQKGGFTAGQAFCG